MARDTCGIMARPSEASNFMISDQNALGYKVRTVELGTGLYIH